MGALKSETEVHVVLSLLGIPCGDVHGTALSVWWMLGIQLSNKKLPDEQLKLNEFDMNFNYCNEAESMMSEVLALA